MQQENLKNEDKGLCQKLRADIQYKRRYVHSICLLWSFVGLGWAIGQMGPSFSDLRRIVNQDLDTSSWLFTIGAIGYMIGSIIGGIMFDRFNKKLMMAVYALVLSVFTGAIPWCKWFPLMMIFKFVSGLGAGGLDTGGNADIISIWSVKGGSFMQALHFSFGVGGILSPLATEPFLSKQTCQRKLENTNISDAVLNVTFFNKTENTTCEYVDGETNVHFAYLVTFSVVFSSSVPFLLMYFVWTENDQNDTCVELDEMSRPNTLPVKYKLLILVLLFCIFFTYCAVEDTFFGFLATFCISHLKWNSSISSFATSLFWASYSLGRFSGIFLIKSFSSVHLLFVFLILLVLSFVGFLVGSLVDSSELVWLFIALIGFAMSIIFPCVFSWTEESILQVSGVISSIFLIAASSGQMLNPLFLGYLMDNISPLWFAYTLLGQSVLCLAIFIILFFLTRRLVTFSNGKNIEDQTTNNIEQVTHM